MLITRPFFFFFNKVKWIILPQQRGLPSIRCAKEETPKNNQSRNNNYKAKAEHQRKTTISRCLG